MPKFKLPTVADDAVIDIQIHETFYRKLTALIIALGQEKTPDDFRKAIESVKDKELPKDVYTLSVQVISQLIYEIELMAQEQKKTKEIELDIPDETTEN